MSFKNPYAPRTEYVEQSTAPQMDRELRTSVIQNDSGLLEQQTQVVDVDPRQEMSKYRESDFRLDQIMLAGGIGLLHSIPPIGANRLDVADALSDGLGRLSDYHKKQSAIAEQAAAEKTAAVQNDVHPVKPE